MIRTSIKILAIAAVVFSGYLYLTQITPTQADTSPITSSLDGGAMNPISTGTPADSQIAQDTAFLATLTSLTRIKIDTTLFKNNAFTSLKDNEVVIEPVTPGRTNPFASINTGPSASGASSTAPAVITGQPTDLTTTTATLNGVTSPGATASYFEYGPTSALGKATSPSLTTLVGSFSSKVTGLTPKTNYFFRASSKINGAVVSGTVIPFTTN
jgi:hypothetical protein